MDKNYAISAIIFSAIISFFLAITSDMSHQELGALVNFIWPPFVGVVTLLLLLLFWWIAKGNNKIRIIIVILLSLYNIYVGLALHFEKDYWPLVLW